MIVAMICFFDGIVKQEGQYAEAETRFLLRFRCYGVFRKNCTTVVAATIVVLMFDM